MGRELLLEGLANEVNKRIAERRADRRLRLPTVERLKMLRQLVRRIDRAWSGGSDAVGAFECDLELLAKLTLLCKQVKLLILP